MRFVCYQRTYWLSLWGILWATTLQAKPSLVKRAIAAFEKEDLTQAKAHIDQATAEEAAQGATWYYRGVIYEKLLRSQVATEEAPQLLETTLAAYRQTLALTPSASQYHSFAQVNLHGLWAYYLGRGRRYYRQEASENALQQFAYSKQIKPAALCTYLYTAIAAHQAANHKLAHANYTHYLEQVNTAPAAVYRALAHLTTALHKAPQEALAVVDQALLQYPFDNDLLFERLQCYKAMGQVEALPTLLLQRIGTAPHEAMYCYQLGYWYEQQGAVAKALEQYERAAVRAPKHIAPIRQQGIVHYNQAAQLTQKIKAMPNEDFQKVGAKQCKQLATYLEKALACFEQAYKIDPRDLFTLKQLQSIYVYQRKATQAEKIARRLRKYER